jgi:Zn-dependent protease
LRRIRMVFTIYEVLDAVLMTLIVGYLFRDALRFPRREGKDVLDYYKDLARGTSWHDFWFACLLIAPAILLHELGHKFVALSFGLDATFHAACSTADLASGVGFLSFTCSIQLLAIALKTMGVNFLIFIPAFVAISGEATHLQQALISFAGPAVHLVFWLGARAMLHRPKLTRKWPQRRKLFLFFFQQINMALFIFNMLPIPGFDGFWVFYHLIKAVF